MTDSLGFGNLKNFLFNITYYDFLDQLAKLNLVSMKLWVIVKNKTPEAQRTKQQIENGDIYLTGIEQTKTVRRLEGKVQQRISNQLGISCFHMKNFDPIKYGFDNPK